MNIGILHPGEMGVSIAASAIKNGHRVFWLPNGRSNKTKERAEKYGLKESASFAEMCGTCEVILSICPPHAAENVANSVIKEGFSGLYLDANAISPKRARIIGEKMKAAGIDFVDGGIMGGPAWGPKNTWLYLSGEKTGKIATIFSKGPLETKELGSEIGRASALKMCYAAYSKGTTALLSAILAVVEANDLSRELAEHWEMEDAGFYEQAIRRARRVTAKAWRFEGEMYEIAETFNEAGIPNGFHNAAAEVYHRMAKFKDAPQMPELNDVLIALLRNKEQPR